MKGIIDKNIDNGKLFDWGKTSFDYARFRDIYPPEFYEKIIRRNLCINGQKVLDLGTGTGVLPRNMYRYGAQWTAADISESQIEQAKLLSKDMDIKYFAISTENMCFSDNSFDVITACQCFWYFDHEKIMPNLYRMLKRGGSILILYMAWLPFEDKVAGASENLVLKYNPEWSGGEETMHPIVIPDCYQELICGRKNIESYLLKLLLPNLKSRITVRLPNLERDDKESRRWQKIRKSRLTPCVFLTV